MATNLYPGVIHFELMKDLPNNPKGSLIFICHADGREHLYGRKVEFTIDSAIGNEDWFRPVYRPELDEKLRESYIQFFIEKGLTEEKAILLFEKTMNEPL